jgi:hypothetical protein
LAIVGARRTKIRSMAVNIVDRPTVFTVEKFKAPRKDAKNVLYSVAEIGWFGELGKTEASYCKLKNLLGDFELN